MYIYICIYTIFFILITFITTLVYKPLVVKLVTTLTFFITKHISFYSANDISYLVCVWENLQILAYLQFQLIFSIIHGSHYTIKLTFTFIYSIFNK